MRKAFVRVSQSFKEARSISIASLFLVPLIYFPWLFSSFTQGKELTFKAILLIGILGVLLLNFKSKEWKLKAIGNSLLFTVLCLQITLHGVTNFASENAMVSIFGTFSRGEGYIMDLYFFAFVIWNGLFLKPTGLRLALGAFWLSALLLSIYAILQKMGIEWFFQNYATNLFQDRVFSFSGNPSLLGQLLALAVVVGVYRVTRARARKSAAFYALGTGLMLFALFLSGTRSAVLALGVMALLATIRYRKKLYGALKAWWKWLIPGLIVLIPLGVWSAPEGRFDISQLSLRSLESRFEIWDGVTTLIQEHWVLGYGQETLYIHFPEVIDKGFFTLEENINISVDRAHNELLEEIYSHGFLAGVLYLFMFALLLKIFFTAKEPEKMVLSGLLLTNVIQNQLSFPDPSIAMLVAFAWGGLVALESKETTVTLPPKLQKSKPLKIAVFSLGVLMLGLLTYHTVVKPFETHRQYTLYKETRSYAEAIEHLKGALEISPYYSELWYELTFSDPSSMGRALANLLEIDGPSGDVLAWQGNFYAESEPELAAEFYLRALEKNPSHPNWIRAFADMLYDQGDCETALYLYAQYLEAVPDYWKWVLDLEARSKTELDSYETFFKHVPYFWGTLEKIEKCQTQLTAE